MRSLVLPSPPRPVPHQIHTQPIPLMSSEYCDDWPYFTLLVSIIPRRGRGGGVMGQNDTLYWGFSRFYPQIPITDPAQLADHLFLQHETFEKLSFPDGIDKLFGMEPSVSWCSILVPPSKTTRGKPTTSRPGLGSTARPCTSCRKKSEKIRNLTLVVISRRITMLTFRMVRYELRCTVTVKIYGDKNVR